MALTPVRVFKKTKTELSVELHGDSWFVVMRLNGEGPWETHCGPYSTMGEAIDWIKAIRET